MFCVYTEVLQYDAMMIQLVSSITTPHVQLLPMSEVELT